MCITLAKLIDFSKLEINTTSLTHLNINEIIILNGKNKIKVNEYTSNGENSLILFLKEQINIKYLSFLIYKDYKFKVSYNELFSTEEFNNKFYYGKNLGLSYSTDKSTFRLWSPVATSVSLLIYKNGDVNINEVPLKFTLTEENGLWSTTIFKDLKNLFYTYKVSVYNATNEVVDPYAKAVGINGLRGAIIDLQETNPPCFNNDYSPKIQFNTDAIIYEISIRDISSHKSSKTFKNGKFLALAENSECIKHIKDLGVTHIQIMPCFDFSYNSTDERTYSPYNWGYDPQNYNVPEGCYSSDPYDPKSRIIEMKKMIQFFHSNNISVNMDVVYNHLFHKANNVFEKIFPGYYLRTDDYGNFSNGSLCGNDTASEHLMMRKFILDSLLYWANEYHIDGFRFDLMGIHDVDTMNLIYNSFKDFNRHIMLYGEGWNLNTLLDDNRKSSQQNAKFLPNFGFFNDIIRDAIKGSVFSPLDKGFVNGKENLENTIKFCTTGCSLSLDSYKAIYISPEQSINYVSCHDNYTLWDKLFLTNPHDSMEDRKSMHKLSNAIILTSQGVPFLHSGVEFCRTKNGVENSFKSGDEINSINFDRKNALLDVYTYYRDLIHLRKTHPAFRMSSCEDIKNHVVFLNDTPKNTVAFILKDYANNDSWRNILVVYNSNNHPVTIPIPFNKWYKVADKFKISNDHFETILKDCVEVDSISLLIMYSD